MGFPHHDDTLPMYLSGELSEMLDFWPELNYYRSVDIHTCVCLFVLLFS
jgi:hypothetical protein